MNDNNINWIVWVVIALAYFSIHMNTCSLKDQKERIKVLEEQCEIKKDKQHG